MLSTNQFVAEYIKNITPNSIKPDCSENKLIIKSCLSEFGISVLTKFFEDKGINIEVRNT